LLLFILSIISSFLEEEPMSKVITVYNASACTPYELRQELVRRGAMDIPEDKANYRSMLQRLMLELVNEQEQQNQQRLAETEAKQKAERDRLKEEREQRKQEALERSQKRREQDPEYFTKRKEAAAEIQESTTEIDPPIIEEQKEEEHKDTSSAEIDPFRAYQPKGRSKIFVK